MKKSMLFFIIIAVTTMVSCNNNSNANEDHSKMDHRDSISEVQNSVADKDVKTVVIRYTSVDPAVTAFMKEMIQNYLAVKNALTENNESAAASASGKMATTMNRLDKSLLNAEQKKFYDGIEAELEKHAEHISKNKIEHQRRHFSMMSESMYDLVKAFGAGMTIYHDHCPMYNDNEGAMWLSETKDIRNPYYADKMMTCGSVEEMFK